MRKLRKTTAAAAGLIGLLAAFGPARPRAADEPTLVLVSHDGHRGRPSAVQFTVEGAAVRGLYPGAVKDMRISIVNPYSFALRIESLSGRVSATSRRSCRITSANLQVRSYVGRLPVTVAARGRTALAGTLPVAMPRQAAANCSDTRFTIVLLGTGTKAAR